MRNRTVGRYGERVAAAFLEAAGMRLLDRNWRCPLGEIDLVALDGGCLVVAEVKTRTSTGCGTGAESVTPAKLARLHRLAAAWLAARPQRPDRVQVDEVRIDVLDVACARRGPAVVTHLRGVG